MSTRPVEILLPASRGVARRGLCVPRPVPGTGPPLRQAAPWGPSLLLCPSHPLGGQQLCHQGRPVPSPGPARRLGGSVPSSLGHGRTSWVLSRIPGWAVQGRLEGYLRPKCRTFQSLCELRSNETLQEQTWPQEQSPLCRAPAMGWARGRPGPGKAEDRPAAGLQPSADRKLQAALSRFGGRIVGAPGDTGESGGHSVQESSCSPPYPRSPVLPPRLLPALPCPARGALPSPPAPRSTRPRPAWPSRAFPALAPHASPGQTVIMGSLQEDRALEVPRPEPLQGERAT